MFPVTEFSFPYQIRISKRAKRMNLKLSADKGVQVVIPAFIPQADALLFLQKHAEWVEKNSHIWQSATQSVMRPDSIDLPAMNKVWRIEYQTNVLKRRATLIEGTENRLIYFGADDLKLMQKTLRQWIEAKTIAYLSDRVQQLSQQTGLAFNKLSFRGQKTLWGSCNRQKNISLNYKLIFLTAHLIDYVLIHELAHTKYLNHGKRFWALVEQFIPDYKSCVKLLRHSAHHTPAWY